MCLHWALDVMFLSVRSSVAYNSSSDSTSDEHVRGWDTTIDYR